MKKVQTKWSLGVNTININTSTWSTSWLQSSSNNKGGGENCGRHLNSPLHLDYYLHYAIQCQWLDGSRRGLVIDGGGKEPSLSLQSVQIELEDSYSNEHRTWKCHFLSLSLLLRSSTASLHQSNPSKRPRKIVRIPFWFHRTLCPFRTWNATVRRVPH